MSSSWRSRICAYPKSCDPDPAGQRRPEVGSAEVRDRAAVGCSPAGPHSKGAYSGSGPTHPGHRTAHVTTFGSPRTGRGSNARHQADGAGRTARPGLGEGETDRVTASHNRTVPSSPPETIRVPSGLNATLHTMPVWPVSGVPRGFPVAASQLPTQGPRPRPRPSGQDQRLTKPPGVGPDSTRNDRVTIQPKLTGSGRDVVCPVTAHEITCRFMILMHKLRRATKGIGSSALSELPHPTWGPTGTGNLAALTRDRGEVERQWVSDDDGCASTCPRLTTSLSVSNSAAQDSVSWFESEANKAAGPECSAADGAPARHRNSRLKPARRSRSSPGTGPARRPRIRSVADTIETRANLAGLTGEHRRGVDDAVRYLRGHADYLR